VGENLTSKKGTKNIKEGKKQRKIIKNITKKTHKTTYRYKEIIKRNKQTTFNSEKEQSEYKTRLHPAERVIQSGDVNKHSDCILRAGNYLHFTKQF
jgi:hypothetical protein